MSSLYDLMERPKDPCERKHGGNEQSVLAFQHLADRLSHDRAQVYDFICRAGLAGATCKEFSAHMGKGQNHYSGRFTELSAKGLILDSCRRRDRSTVWVSRNAVLPTDGGAA